MGAVTQDPALDPNRDCRDAGKGDQPSKPSAPSRQVDHSIDDENREVAGKHPKASDAQALHDLRATKMHSETL